jgi:hypothetical protein
LASLPLVVATNCGPDPSKANADKGPADVVFRLDPLRAISLREELLSEAVCPARADEATAVNDARTANVIVSLCVMDLVPDLWRLIAPMIQVRAARSIVTKITPKLHGSGDNKPHVTASGYYGIAVKFRPRSRAISKQARSLSWRTGLLRRARVG